MPFDILNLRLARSADAASNKATPSSRIWTPSGKAIVWTFIAIGILLRFREYLFNRALWYDESWLALNIISLSPAGLMKQLEYNQAAPLGFLWLEKLSVHYLGSGEMALRLVPFISGIASVFIFVAVARRFLPTTILPIAVAFFAFSRPLIYYSAEAKQYSSDVALTLLLYLVTGPLFEASLGVASMTIATTIGALAIWCSHPAVFVLGGIGLSALWTAARKRDRPALILIFVSAAIWACSFLIFYIVVLRNLSNNRLLFHMWRDAFAPFPLSSRSNLLWYVHSFFDIFSYPVGLAFTGIAAMMAVLGVMEFRARNVGKLLSLLLPIALTLLASSMHRYPFQGRLLLFLVPSLLLMITAGLGTVQKTTWEALPLMNVLLVGFLFLNPLWDSGNQFVKPTGRQEIRPAIDYIEKHLSQGDVLYCYYGAEPALQYYRQRGLIRPVNQVTGVASPENWELYRLDLDKLRGRRRVWILFSHVSHSYGVDEQLLFLDYLNQIGKRLGGMQVTGASAFLYDLSNDGTQSDISGISSDSIRPELAK